MVSRTSPIPGRGVSQIAPGPSTLTGGYNPGPDQPDPGEIVAALHGEIAAKSPEHARLVAAFEAKQAANRRRP